MRMTTIMTRPVTTIMLYSFIVLVAIARCVAMQVVTTKMNPTTSTKVTNFATSAAIVHKNHPDDYNDQHGMKDNDNDKVGNIQKYSQQQGNRMENTMERNDNVNGNKRHYSIPRLPSLRRHLDTSSTTTTTTTSSTTSEDGKDDDDDDNGNDISSSTIEHASTSSSTTNVSGAMILNTTGFASNSNLDQLEILIKERYNDNLTKCNNNNITQVRIVRNITSFLLSIHHGNVGANGRRTEAVSSSQNTMGATMSSPLPLEDGNNGFRTVSKKKEVIQRSIPINNQQFTTTTDTRLLQNNNNNTNFDDGRTDSTRNNNRQMTWLVLLTGECQGCSSDTTLFDDVIAERRPLTLGHRQKVRIEKVIMKHQEQDQRKPNRLGSVQQSDNTISGSGSSNLVVGRIRHATIKQDGSHDHDDANQVMVVKQQPQPPDVRSECDMPVVFQKLYSYFYTNWVSLSFPSFSSYFSPSLLNEENPQHPLQQQQQQQQHRDLLDSDDECPLPTIDSLMTLISPPGYTKNDQDDDEDQDDASFHVENGIAVIEKDPGKPFRKDNCILDSHSPVMTIPFDDRSSLASLVAVSRSEILYAIARIYNQLNHINGRTCDPMSRIVTLQDVAIEEQGLQLHINLECFNCQGQLFEEDGTEEWNIHTVVDCTQLCPFHHVRGGVRSQDFHDRVRYNLQDYMYDANNDHDRFSSPSNCHSDGRRPNDCDDDEEEEEEYENDNWHNSEEDDEDIDDDNDDESYDDEEDDDSESERDSREDHDDYSDDESYHDDGEDEDDVDSARDSLEDNDGHSDDESYDNEEGDDHDADFDRDSGEGHVNLSDEDNYDHQDWESENDDDESHSDDDDNGDDHHVDEDHHWEFHNHDRDESLSSYDHDRVDQPFQSQGSRSRHDDDNEGDVDDGGNRQRWSSEEDNDGEENEVIHWD